METIGSVRMQVVLARTALVATHLLVGLWIGAALPAWGASVVCGGTIGPGGTVKLDADVGPCAFNQPITVTGSAVLNLNGHQISCNQAVGFQPVIILNGQGAVVKKGRLTGCGIAVLVLGQGNTVNQIDCDQNIDCIWLGGNGGHTVTKNDIHNNGHTGIVDIDSAGLNRIRNNNLQNNGFSGIYIQQNGDDVRNNKSDGNGGSGIQIAAGGATVRNNHTSNNLMHGIFVGGNILGQNNDIRANRALGNTDSDLADAWGDCAHNMWKKNSFGTRNPLCIQ